MLTNLSENQHLQTRVTYTCEVCVCLGGLASSGVMVDDGDFGSYNSHLSGWWGGRWGDVHQSGDGVEGLGDGIFNYY